MGMADLVPGVSGGTVALITGFYDRLISALRSVSAVPAVSFLRGDWIESRKALDRIDFTFLIPLGLGIGTAIVGGANLMKFLIDHYSFYTYAFFSGLIIASALVLYQTMEWYDPRTTFAVIMGIVIAVIVSGIEGVGLNHGYGILFISGSVAICAMILPGISGAFLLLLLGQYEFILTAISNLGSSYLSLIIFGLGAISGLAVFTRVLSYLLDNYPTATHGFLVGLMLGALRRPISIMIGYEGLRGGPEGLRMLPVLGAIVLAIIGGGLVDIISRYTKLKN